MRRIHVSRTAVDDGTDRMTAAKRCYNGVRNETGNKSRANEGLLPIKALLTVCYQIEDRGARSGTIRSTTCLHPGQSAGYL